MTCVTYPDKAFATLQAQAALQGVALHRLENDRGQEIYIGTKWAMTRQMHSLDEVEMWLNRIAGKVVPA